MEVVELSMSGTPLLRVTGDVDHYQAPAFKNAVCEVLDRNDPPLLLDLAACRYLDSGGLSVLISVLAKIRERGWMGLIGSSPDLVRIFEITGLTVLPEFRLFATREEASTALTGGC
jgi:anti-sigma B factor antagonist